MPTPQLPPPRAIAYVGCVIVDLRTGSSSSWPGSASDRRTLTVDQARDLVVQLLNAIDLAALEAGVDVTSWPPLAWPATQPAPLEQPDLLKRP